MTDGRTVSVHSLSFGDIEIAEDKVLLFREGLPGFPQLHRFAVLQQEDLEPFHCLQALDDPPIALLLLNPMLVDPGYKLELTASDLEELQLDGDSDLSVYAVATIPENPDESTLNLVAPIVINERKRLGKQVILQEGGYSVKHRFLAASRKSDSGER